MGVSIHIVGCAHKQKMYAEQLETYVHRLKPYAELVIKQLKPIEATYRNRDQALLKEEKALIIHWPVRCRSVALSEEGKLLDSRQFAQTLAKLIEANRCVVFNVGGAFGLSQSLKKRCEMVVSLSKLTFPHQICFLILAEQIYRAFTILTGHPYHK